MQNKTTIIGIAGGSGSGKSTLAEILQDTLIKANITCQAMSMDVYAVEDKTTGPQFLLSSTGESLFDWNHPDAFDSERLVADIEEIANTKNAPDVIVIEGLMVLHWECILKLLDLRLFVELDADIRALRRMLRNIKRGQDPQFIADYYVESARVGHERYVEPSRGHADIILRGDADFERTAELICKHLRLEIAAPENAKPACVC